MLDKILGKKDKNQKTPSLRKNENSSGSNLGGRLMNMVSKPKGMGSQPKGMGSQPKGMASQPKNKASQPNILVSKVDDKAPKPKGIFSKLNEKISKPKDESSQPNILISKVDDKNPNQKWIIPEPEIVPEHEPEIVPEHEPEIVPEPEEMDFKPNDNSQKIEAKGPEVDNKASEDPKDSEDPKEDSPMKKIPRPMPKPRPKKRPDLKPPQDKDKKPGGGFAGFGRRIPTRIPDDDRRTLIGAAVFSVILIVLAVAGYYFLVYAPYQNSLQTAKTAKINEVNAYYKGALTVDPQKQMLTAQIDGAKTPDQALAVDVIGPATQSWRLYQNQQISTKQDPYGRVMITYTAGGQKDLIIKTADAQTVVKEADASVLANMEIKEPDTVAIPIIVSRLQAAGGLINVGDAVDVYLNTNTTTTAPVSNNTTSTPAVSTVNQTTPQISGATVLAILRWQGSGSVNANMSHSQSVAVNTFTSSSSSSQSASTDVEQLLRASASRSLNVSQINSLVEAYGWRLSDFERVSNLGELDAQYLVMLEIPRENALWLIQNYPSVVLTVPTNKAPSWMVDELHNIYG